MKGKITTVLTKKEAEIYRAQGLHEEARKLYDGLLSSSPNIDPDLRSAVQSKIRQINQELGQSATPSARESTGAEILHIKNCSEEKASAPDMLICAQALLEIGSYEDALVEYVNLINLTGVKKSYMDPIARCLVHLHQPQLLPIAAEQLAKGVCKSAKICLAMQLSLAKQMATHQYIDHALAMYTYMRQCAEFSPESESVTTLDLLATLDKCIQALSVTSQEPPEQKATETSPPPLSEETAEPRHGVKERSNPFNMFRHKKKAK